MSDAPKAGKPLFYIDPQPLTPTRHAAFGLRRSAPSNFAKGAVATPVTVGEFALAMRHYPIVFVGEKASPVALLSLGADNRFVDEAGRWAPGYYVPAYVRRYPFVFIEHPDGDKLALGIDEGSDLLATDAATTPDAAPLFDNGEPSALTKDALEFCGALHQDTLHTQAFAEAVKAAGILVRDQKAQVPAGSVNLGEGMIVDEKLYRALPDATLLEWRKRGWNALIAMHFASLSRLAALASASAPAAGRA